MRTHGRAHWPAGEFMWRGLQRTSSGTGPPMAISPSPGGKKIASQWNAFLRAGWYPTVEDPSARQLQRYNSICDQSMWFFVLVNWRVFMHNHLSTECTCNMFLPIIHLIPSIHLQLLWFVQNNVISVYCCHILLYQRLCVDLFVGNSESMEEGDVTGVDLGFMERDFDPWETQSRHFPSKIGGKPAWLDLAKLPPPKQQQCPHCALPLTFLLQVYSPDNNSDSAFHRSMFVFLCLASPCWDQGKEPPVLVLRSHP